MSKIKFAPNGIGSGEFTIAAPGTGTNRVMTLPDVTGTVVVNQGDGIFAISANGNVGIGTGSPSSRLEIAHATAPDIRLTVGSTLTTNFFGSSGGTTLYTVPALPLLFGTTNTTRMTISAAGAINFSNLYGVTVTTPRNVFVNAAGDIGGISSVRASKTNITSMSDANWVLDLNPVTFNYRKKDEDGNFTEDFDTEKMYGLIAEDAAEVNPDICIYNEVDGQQVLASIHYDRLIAPIIKVLKDQQAMIEALQAKVAELQGV